MKILSPRVHGYLDYLVVVAFALAPSILGFSKTPATICYVLAVVHLIETLITAFPLGLFKWMPFTVHGSIEFVISFVLVALPWIAGFSGETAARNYFVGSGIALFLVWLTTDYKAAGSPATYRPMGTTPAQS